MNPAWFPTWPDDAELIVAAEAELRRRHPHRRWPPILLAETAAEIVSAAKRAWSCFAADATFAVFDVLAFFDAIGLSPPIEVAHVRDSLIAIGAGWSPGGDAEPPGRGVHSSWDRHVAALRKRFRAEVVGALLDEAELRRHVDDLIKAEAERGLIDPEAWADEVATRRAVPDGLKRACALAAQRLGEPIEWRAVYGDYRAVNAARAQPGWPGAFYVPSHDTAERFGIAEASALVRLVGSDGPLWRMV